MIGVTRSAGAHFLGEVFDHSSWEWFHFNSCYETARDRKQGYTLTSVSKEFPKFEGVFKNAVCVHYVRVE